MVAGDEADVAAVFEERAREAALAAQRAVVQESPDEDAQGNRYCLDCGERIPAARVQAVQAVRCVDCAGLRERARPRALGHGIRRYLQPENAHDSAPIVDIDLEKDEL